MMGKDNTLYLKTVRVTEDYLGPAGERFIRRQISTHLNIEPESLNKKNLSTLIEWSVIAFAMVTNDSKDIDAFTEELKSLAVKGK